MKIIDLPAALKALEHAVKLKGADFTYEYPEGVDNCAYTDKEGNPSCLVGYVLADLKPQWLAEIHENEWSVVDDEYDYDTGDYTERDMINELSVDSFEDIYFTSAATQVLMVAQELQDRHKPWGEAVAEAKKKAELIAI